MHHKKIKKKNRNLYPSNAFVNSSLSSKGCLTPFISWYFSCPLPAKSIISPFCANLTAVRIACRRSGISKTYAMSLAVISTFICSIILRGSSERGLSDVRINVSLIVAPILPIIRLLAASLSPPAPVSVIIF